MKYNKLIQGLFCALTLLSCNNLNPIGDNSNEEMVKTLAAKHKAYNVRFNAFAPAPKLAYCDSVLQHTTDPTIILGMTYLKSNVLLKLGREQEAIQGYEAMMTNKELPKQNNLAFIATSELALSYLRLGERQNCINNHTVESCIMPIQNTGIHTNTNGSEMAIQVYQNILNHVPDDYESRWLMNIAYMTLGKYPNGVPKPYLIAGLDQNDPLYSIKPFVDVAPGLGLNKRNMAGGVIVDDFNNDDYLDIITSDWDLEGVMHCYINDKKGGFVDQSEVSNLSKFTGGLHLVQADYDNDGDIDILVLRGAWKGKYGRQPNSLLQNDGKGVFTDVTRKSGLYSEFPTQTAVWRDFNNDGWLDIFIGNETKPGANEMHPCQLYINKKGIFTEVAQKANCQVVDFIKGVTAADFDKDGQEDLVLSGSAGKRYLLKNKGSNMDIPQFEDVTKKAGLGDVTDKNSFSTWFWDYDNDGWQDIFICGYDFAKQAIGTTVAREALGMPNPDGSSMFLYHNNGNGTFTNVTKTARLDKAVFGMGSNFGDIDNDGYLDMYIGTGSPDYKALVPNRLFRNMGNGTFADVTVSGRVGNLQKGHGVAMNDLDNDGDTDIFIEVGGAFVGDSYNNALYLNPGQNKNNWIKLKLEGTDCNRSAIGTKIKVTFRENGVQRTVYQEVNSGSSFGSSSLRREIGIGQAETIDAIEITWHKSNKKQVFKDIKPNQCLRIVEHSNDLVAINLTPFDFTKNANMPMCNPTTTMLDKANQ